uniref:FZ domain-containing protein n=1 Tax=Timema monikensis TaxID=170555 RepID=A0A7R9EII3_9NEOP|nr:unnamed protein product [Timema monikensis]
MTQRWLAALLAVIATCGARAHFSDWGGLLGGGRPSQPTCVDIPRNMSLCHGIGYHQMRLPNLLEHDTMAEVLQQAGSWVPLLNVRCHPDTQLFVCSLFSPVCLDRPIYPCRSLCDQVRQGCEGRMKTYGFPWPDMFRCDKFPLDNDMCIASQSAATTEAIRSLMQGHLQLQTREHQSKTGPALSKGKRDNHLWPHASR